MEPTKEQQRARAMLQQVRDETREAGRQTRTYVGPMPIYSHRTWLLVWAYVRGLPYRRVERHRRTQTREDGSVFEHNKPQVGMVGALACVDESLRAEFEAPERFLFTRPVPTSPTKALVEAWLADPAGAIPEPPPRPKKPYVPPTREQMAGAVPCDHSVQSWWKDKDGQMGCDDCGTAIRRDVATGFWYRVGPPRFSERFKGGITP